MNHFEIYHDFYKVRRWKILILRNCWEGEVARDPVKTYPYHTHAYLVKTYQPEFSGHNVDIPIYLLKRTHEKESGKERIKNESK